jgi:hypothetical protein
VISLTVKYCSDTNVKREIRPFVRGSEKIEEPIESIFHLRMCHRYYRTALTGEAFNAVLNPSAIRVHPDVTNQIPNHIFNGSFDTLKKTSLSPLDQFSCTASLPLLLSRRQDYSLYFPWAYFFACAKRCS